MKKLATIILALTALLILTLVSGCGANTFTATKSAGDYTVELSANHNPLTAGENHLQLAISDKSGAVTDAKVKVGYSMAAMPGMPAMNHSTYAGLNGQKYDADIDLMMAGSWTISVQIDRGGKIQKVDFAVDAH